MNNNEKSKLDKLNARYKRQNERISEKYDRVSVVLPKGTSERIKGIGTSANQFINSAVISELDRLERGECPTYKSSKAAPKEVNGKPVYRFYNEEEYIKDGEWWHDVVFFYDDMELNDLFVKLLDKTAIENENYKDGCRLIYDLVELSRTGSKYSDEEIFNMTEGEIKNTPDIDLCFDQTEELKRLIKESVYNGENDNLLDFIGFNALVVE